MQQCWSNRLHACTAVPRTKPSHGKPTHRARCFCRGAGGTFGQQAEALAAPLDVLVGTPGKVAQHAAKGNLFYGDVQLVRW